MGDAGQELARLAPSGQQLEFAMMTVDSVRDDGTVNLAQGGTIHEAVPCQNSYLGRQAGDVVVVARWRAGWQVIGKAGAEYTPPAPAPGVKVSWGASAPAGAGWVTGTPWVRAGELYIQTAAGGGTSAPGPVTLAPSSQGAWRDGGLDSGQPPTQGAWPTYPHPYTGAWFWSGAAAACAGNTVQSMTLRIARTASRHGSYGSVRPQLYLLAASSAGGSTPTLGDGPVPGPSLGLGASGTFAVPSSWQSAIATGAAGGIGMFAPTGSQYLIATASCGQLTINFA